MSSSDFTDSTSRNLDLSRLDQTNSLISLANSSNPSLAVNRLSHLLSTRDSFALSNPTFEALNRITFSYALLRAGDLERGKQEMNKVGEMLILDQGKREREEKSFVQLRRDWQRREKNQLLSMKGCCQSSPT